MRDKTKLIYILLLLPVLAMAIPPLEEIDPCRDFNKTWNEKSNEERKNILKKNDFKVSIETAYNGFQFEFRKYNEATIPYFIYVTYDFDDWHHLVTITPWDSLIKGIEFENKIMSYRSFEVPQQIDQDNTIVYDHILIEILDSNAPQKAFITVVMSDDTYTCYDYSRDRDYNYIIPPPFNTNQFITNR